MTRKPEPIGRVVAVCDACGSDIGERHPYAWCAGCGASLREGSRALTREERATAELRAATTDRPRPYWIAIAAAASLPFWVLAGLPFVPIAVLAAVGAATWVGWKVWEVMSAPAAPPRLIAPAPRKQETNYPCPVCLGTAMTKLRPSARVNLVLDYCKRCGGIWFDAGEVAGLRECRPKSFYRHIVLHHSAHRTKCHECGASFARNKPTCPACGWTNVLSCPVCRATMQPTRYQNLRLDACRGCHGVWFDNIELSELWNLKVERYSQSLAAARRRTPRTVEQDHFFLGDWLWIPDVHFDGAGEALGHAVAGLPEVAGSAVGGLADVAGDVVEGTGELAGSVFGSISEILGDLFGGLDFDF